MVQIRAIQKVPEQVQAMEQVPQTELPVRMEVHGEYPPVLHRAILPEHRNLILPDREPVTVKDMVRLTVLLRVCLTAMDKAAVIAAVLEPATVHLPDMEAVLEKLTVKMPVPPRARM